METPKGDVDLLKLVLEGANKEVDESSEERKGGAGAIGKCFYSAGDDWVRACCVLNCTKHQAFHVNCELVHWAG